MKNRQTLIKLLVLLALFGFVACSFIMFYKSFALLGEDGKLPNNYLNSINASLIYITSGLTGLVGGIVATAFGVKQPEDDDANLNFMNNYNFKSLGRMITTPSDDSVNNNKEKYGFLYALSYIIIGVVSIIIWVWLEDNTIQAVSNMATTFFGMMIPIVAAYFNN